MLENASREHSSGMRVELIDSMGDDLAIVNAARVSFGERGKWEYYRWSCATQSFVGGSSPNPFNTFHKAYDNPYENQWYKCLSVRDAGTLNYMMREKHGTPFEMVAFKFRIFVPIGVVWEWVRHRIASYNVMSTRYVKMPDKFYIPALADMRTQVGKSGHYLYEPLDLETAEQASIIYAEAMKDAYGAYGELLRLGLAKELARNVLPMGLFTEFIWSVNLRSLFNFLKLRTAPDALYEIQIPAKMVESLASQVVPESFNAWRRYGKVTP